MIMRLKHFHDSLNAPGRELFSTKLFYTNLL